ncbi:MAG: hypothetical protein AB7I27_01295 [Bacteriovoracaceae bacterium]
MDVRYLVILFLLASCLPEPKVARTNLANDSTGTGTTSNTTTITGTKWNYLGEVSSSITINVSNLNNAYIVGSNVEDYLATISNFSTANYCFVSTYNLGGVYYELRSRIVPISYYDFTNKKTVKILRVDFQDVTNSTSLCSGTLRVKNSNGDYIADPVTPSSTVYDPSLVCPSCTANLTASKVRVFVRNTYLDEVDKNLINTTQLTLLLDPNNSTTSNSGTCSNSSCQSLGYDCCLDNQCVNDGTTRPSASSLYSSQLQVAEQARLQNPLAYLNYPHLYYICGSSVPSTGSSGSSGSYDEGLSQLAKDYKCIEHIKAQSSVSPFQSEVLTRTSPYVATTDCLTDSGDSAQTYYYQTVIKRLYTNCGCSKTALSDMITYCPAYDYTVVSRNASGEPNQINCYTPPTTTVPIPTQQTISLNSRSAPHRFFDNTGVERNILSGGTSYTQEGDSFSYLDDSKVIPVQSNFSMNAILGPMSVSLDKALPAKSVSVEVDQIYLISTTSGYYTACPTCGKDTWLESLSPFPSSAMGVGLQSVGHTTERDAFSTNTTGGNYEDTIFGRACWIPPTMLPYSHSSKTTVSDQRLNRLQTQAALFVNGHQRDWYGFNKGALIGSFDGVTWFAIGKGRIVRSTSTKLFLAINAPFADLANPSLHVVNVQAYDGITQAAQVDYDPQYHLSHPYQNEAGNCQANHFCTTDTECITRLGWEYACADIKEYKTNWPSFDVDGAEQVGSTATTFDQILQQKKLPSSSTKRCVYRGAGALCLVNSGSITDLNKKKSLTCAPNFYCASVSTSSSVFNSKVARYASKLEDIPVARNHIYGKDANVLGRPLSYVSSSDTTTLLTDIATTLAENLANYESSATTTTTGICRPGKNLPTTVANQATNANPFIQHMSEDASKRTDFISQIGSCNSGLFTSYRYSSCPVIGSDGNYDIFTTATTSFNLATYPATYPAKARAQNACGLDTLYTGTSLALAVDTLSNYSPFKSIEAKPLNSQVVVDPTFARDACMRRAGQVCHTDYDCSPNKKHADLVDYFNLNYFGNAAEKSYYSEYLVCGQSDPKPLPTESNFKTYDMTINRCCREVGKDLTTYTSDIPTATYEATYDSASYGLKMSTAPGIAPSDSKRYSRLATVDDLGTASRPILSAYQDRDGFGVIEANSQSVNVMTTNQWKTLNEANSETCCGGGWIRKFYDGSNDWTRRDRFHVDVNNFKCINSRTPLITNPVDVASQYASVADVNLLVSQDLGDYCKDGTNTLGSCAQFGATSAAFTDSITHTLPSTVGQDYGTVTVNTVVPSYSSSNVDFFFKPKSADSDSQTFIDYSNSAVTARRNISIKIPSFITRDFDSDVTADNTDPSSLVYMTNEIGATYACKKDLTIHALLVNPTDNNIGCSATYCCYSYDSTTRILKVVAPDTLPAAFSGKKMGVKFTADTAGKGLSLARTRPGSTSYYLTRLARLELSGIPQITFAPLYCNDNSNRIVPGIFSSSITTKTDFQNTNFSFSKDGLGGQYTSYLTNYLGLQDEPIFSSNDFKCCTPLGKTTKDQKKCCSGYGTLSGSTYTCALPAGTDLMLYFNRYISNEGRGTDQPGGGLVEADFDELTGEPANTNVTSAAAAALNQKIAALGVAYCASKKVRQGGAFGLFEPEPQGIETNLSSRIYNLVDSSRDTGTNSNAGQTVTTGYNAFMNGFRWNHHLYCDD